MKHYLSLAVLLTGLTGYAQQGTNDSQNFGREHDRDLRSSYIGILGGGNSSNNTYLSNASNLSPTVGLTVGALITPEIGVGIFGSNFGQTSSGTLLGLPTNASANVTTLAGQLNYFSGGFHIGGEAGVAASAWTGSISRLYAGTTNTQFVFGPDAGYDFRLSRGITIGAEAHYFLSGNDSSMNNLQAFGALKLWM